MQGNDASAYACLKENGHLWVYWLCTLKIFVQHIELFFVFFLSRDYHLNLSRMPDILAVFVGNTYG